MSGELETENARVGAVDEPQAKTLAAANRKGIGDLAVHRHRVADAAVVGHVVEVVEIVADLRIAEQSPVTDHPNEIAIDLDRSRLLDDQRPAEAPAHLYGAVLVRVVPVGAGIGYVELVGEGLAGRDGFLRQVGDAVHGIGHPDPVPVHRRLLRQPILDDGTDALALTHAYLGSGHLVCEDQTLVSGCGGPTNDARPGAATSEKDLTASGAAAREVRRGGRPTSVATLAPPSRSDRRFSAQRSRDIWFILWKGLAVIALPTPPRRSPPAPRRARSISAPPLEGAARLSPGWKV